MSTSFSSIIDRASIGMDDFRLQNLKEEQPEQFTNIMIAFLVKGVPKFKNCQQSLAYDLAQTKFTSDLTEKEQDILADLTILQWYTRNLNDVKKFEEILGDADFKRYAVAPMLRARQAHEDGAREKLSQDQTDYSVENLKAQYKGSVLNNGWY